MDNSTSTSDGNYMYVILRHQPSTDPSCRRLCLQRRWRCVE